MKDSRILKILLIIVIIAAIVGITLLFKNKGGKTASEEETKIAEELTQTVLDLKTGYNIKFNGKELLYEKDKLTYDDLSRGNILYTASNYVIDHNLANSVPTNILTAIEEKYNYSMNKYTAFRGEAIREAIKEFFGKEYKNQSAIDEANFGYNFIYIEEYDLYLKGRNESYVLPDGTAFIKTKAIKTTKEKDSLVTEIAVAYVEKVNDVYQYNKDLLGKNTIYEAKSIEDIDSDKEKEFEHYLVTFTKDGDNYIFESIAKK